MKDLRTTYNELKAKAKSLMTSGNISEYIITLNQVNKVKRKMILMQIAA